MLRSQYLNPLSASITKWSHTFKQLQLFKQIIFSVFDHFMGLTLKWLMIVLTNLNSKVEQSYYRLNHLH